MKPFLFVLTLGLCGMPGAVAQGFVQTEFKDSAGTQLRYAILKPAKIKPDTKYPLVVSLHGSGGRGSKKWQGNCAANKVLSQPAMRQKYPCYIIAPTIYRNQKWDGAPLTALIELVKSSLKKHAIDPDRIYVTGQSMGGAGAYSAILAEPNLFAAAVPVCGRGQPELAKKIVHIPIWIFHGELDRVVPTIASRNMVAALKKAGGKPTYTEYEGVRHNSWTAAYADKKLWEWLFAQKRGGKVVLDDPEAKVIITDPIVEKAIRKRLRKPTGELTKADLGKVTTLSLRNSKLTDTGLKEVANLQQLTSLDLSLCKQITDAGLMEVARLQQLTSLNLFFCKQITDAGLKGLTKCTKLTSLDLPSTKITDEGLKEVAKLQQLTSLDLSACERITDEGLKEVTKLQHLTTLDLDACEQITDAGLKEVAKLEKLTELALFATKITDAGLKEVAKLESLTNLGLNKTQVTDAGFKEIAKLENLTKLDLQNTQVTDTGLKDVAKHQEFSMLNVEGTKVTKAGVAQLRKALGPRCSIYSNAKEQPKPRFPLPPCRAHQ